MDKQIWWPVFMLQNDNKYFRLMKTWYESFLCYQNPDYSPQAFFFARTKPCYLSVIDGTNTRGLFAKFWPLTGVFVQIIISFIWWEIKPMWKVKFWYQNLSRIYINKKQHKKCEKVPLQLILSVDFITWKYYLDHKIRIE